jgi:acetyl esterase/lipase
MIRRPYWRSACALLALLSATPQIAAAQEAAPTFRFEPASRPSQVDAIPLGTGPQLPGVPPESWFRLDGEMNVRNVSEATLTPFLPNPGKATGTAVIVAPGGGFLGLAIETEGYAVARWLADHGIAAFVLKYRLVPTPADPDIFMREMTAGRTGKPSSVRPPQDTPDFARDDGLAALALVRSRAKAWRIDPARIGMMGFSAGAFTTIVTTLSAKSGERPAFIAPIYGRLTARDVPADAPPMFAVLAADDHFFAAQGFGLIDGWLQAKRPVEFHLYQNGGHGFGLGRPGTTSDGWIAGFVTWLQTNHLLPAR